MGLPPKLFPDNFLRNNCSFFLSTKLLSSKLSNSYKILKIEEFALEDSLAAKKPVKVRNWISILISLFIVIKHSFLFLNARSSWVIINWSPFDKEFSTGNSSIFKILYELDNLEDKSIGERKKEQLLRRKLSGNNLGGRPKISPLKESLVIRLRKEGYSYRSIRSQTGIALSTIRRVILEGELT